MYINLINNAIYAYTQKNIEHKKISFFYEKNNTLIIKCIDEAGGIPNKIINRVFQSNFTTKEDGKGTGIGLYFTKQIVEKNNGKIHVENYKNGCCFTISIK